MSYDQKCYDLAETFLADQLPDGPIPAGAPGYLAQQIQDLIDSFIEADLVELREEAKQAARDNSQFGVGA